MLTLTAAPTTPWVATSGDIMHVIENVAGDGSLSFCTVDAACGHFALG
jgi:hypothetical protein